MTGRRAVVVGAGIAGLATAALLARDGWDVEVLERRDEVGGRAGLWEQDGFRFDTGPSWYLMPEVFDAFFASVGTSSAEQLDLRTLDPAYRVLYEGVADPLDVSPHLAENIAAFERLEPGAGAALERYLDSARDAYGMAMRRFLYTSFTSPTALVRPDVLARLHRLAPLLLGSLESFVARRFRDRRLRQLLGYPAVFLGSSPDRTPALYHLMSSLDLDGGVQYPMGGIAALIDAVAGAAWAQGARVRTGTEVVAIRTAAGGLGARRARVTGVAVRDADGHREIEADLVVAAADLHHVETALLPAHLQTYPERWWRRRDPGPGGVLAYLGVRGRVPELAHHTLLFTQDWHRNFGDIAAGRVPSPASAYVCAPSRTDPGVAPADHENLFLLVPMPARPDLGRGGLDGGGDPAVERVVDDALDQIASWAGVPDLKERVVLRRTVGPGDFAADLHAWRGGMLGPAHTLAQSAMFRAGNASRRVSGLYYAGSGTIPGIGLPMCVISADVVAARIAKEHPATSATPA